MALRMCMLLLITTVVHSQGDNPPDCSLETDGSTCDSEPSEDGQEPSSESVELDQTIPKILIVGPTGSGKSSMANSLLGLDPETEDVMFSVCGGWDSCTKGTTFATGAWLGDGPNFTVIDTPGLGDSEVQDPELIREMLDVLKNTVKSVDAIVLLISGEETRFNSGLKSMLVQMSSIFGDQWWDFLLIGVSFWEYDLGSIRKRERRCPGKSCKNENWFKSEVQMQLEKNFYQTQPFPFAFIHSFSQTKYNIDDLSQQKNWQQETEKLWTFVTSKTTSFELKGVDDILEDNQRLKREVEDLNNTINTEIANLKASTQSHAALITSNKETCDAEIQQLETKITGLITRNNGAIADLQIFVAVCAYQSSFKTPGCITYDSLLTNRISDNSRLDINTGIYRAVTGGLYEISFGGMTISGRVDIRVNIDGVNKQETYYAGMSMLELDMGTRTTFVCLRPGQKIYLDADINTLSTSGIHIFQFCINLIHTTTC